MIKSVNLTCNSFHKFKLLIFLTNWVWKIYPFQACKTIFTNPSDVFFKSDIRCTGLLITLELSVLLTESSNEFYKF